MILTIDSFDGAGARDFTRFLDAENPMRITRKLNQPAQLVGVLVAEATQMIVPSVGGRVIMARGDGYKLFTGYLSAAPEFEYLGWTQSGPAYRYTLHALGDEFILDRKVLPRRSAMVARTAGSILRQLTTDLAPAVFDVSGVEELETIPVLPIDPEQSWSAHAAAIALRMRSSYRVHDSKVTLKSLGGVTHVISEADGKVIPEALKIATKALSGNQVIVRGNEEPREFVKDYFLGDGVTTNFSLSQPPFIKQSQTIFEEEFKGAALDATRWTKQDPSAAIHVSGGKLFVSGGTGADGQTVATFAELVEMGGAITLYHGEAEFTAASDAIIGGLYSGAVLHGNCVAGFRITPSGGQCLIRALVNGAESGAGITTIAGHRYGLTTRIIATEPFRAQQVFHYSLHPQGSGRGGAAIASNIRVVLEAHDIDPANAGSFAAASIVLYDAVIPNAPAYCTYALINAVTLTADIAFCRMLRAIDAEVRSTVPSQAPRTRLVGTIGEGAECNITSSPQLLFYSPFTPVPSEAIVVRYRGHGHSLAQAADAASIAAHASGTDDGVRGTFSRVKLPEPRLSVDCENAALALLDDKVLPAHSGVYQTWSDFLPGGASSDPLPGDAVNVIAPSRGENFTATLRDVEIGIVDLANDRSLYKLSFANDAAASLSFHVEQKISFNPDPAEIAIAGATVLPNLSEAEVTAITSTTVSIDAGVAPPAGGAIEVRRTDFAWNPSSDRNLIGRFSTQAFTVPRLTRIQNYHLRQYDSANPPNYSQYSTVLHVNYPL
jgi:hypothetical protein